MVDLALLLHLRTIFIGTFFYSRPEYKPSRHYYWFSRHTKMVLSKTNTSL